MLLIDCNVSTARVSTKHVKVTGRLDEIIKHSGSAPVWLVYSFDSNLRFYILKLAVESQSACHLKKPTISRYHLLPFVLLTFTMYMPDSRDAISIFS